MAFAVVSFSVVFLLITSGGLLLFYREAMLQRISDVINPQRKKRTLLTTIQETGLTIGGVVERFDAVIPKSKAEVSITMKRLTRAGFRNESAVKLFYGSKVLIPLFLCAIVLVSGLGKHNALFMYGAALGLGFLGPDFWLGRRIKARQYKLRKGLPDVLDLLIICIEAGLSLDQATARASQELVKAQPEMCEELTMVVLEQRAGRPRSEAWKHLADRTDLDCIRSLVSMLIQSEQLGTSIGKTLRTHSDTMRVQRVQSVEEAAAKLTIKLLFPLVLFIFPALFVVVLGPAAIQIIGTLGIGKP
jgi:tight adherence protein C